MANGQGGGQGNRPTVEVEGVEADEVADLLEELAKQIRSKGPGAASGDQSTPFTRVNTGQLFDLVHRS